MNLNIVAQEQRELLPRQSLTMVELHTLWRIESGVLRIDSIGTDGISGFVRLALRGDLIGMENLVGVSDTLAVQALTSVTLVPVSLTEESQLTGLLMESLSKNHQRCRELVRLRTGSVVDRVKCLLQLLVGVDARSDISNACTLPSLINMAEIVNSTRETVCRVLTNLRESQFLVDSNPSRVKYMPLENREHRLQAIP